MIKKNYNIGREEHDGERKGEQRKIKKGGEEGKGGKKKGENFEM